MAVCCRRPAVSFFKGNGDGLLVAYDAASGERLWQFNAGLGIIGAPISYSVAGRQYVSILVGYGGATAIWSQLMPRGWKYGAQPRRLLTFGLGGKAPLPPTAPRSDSLNALDDPAVKINDADAASGTGDFQFGLLGMPRPESQFSRLARPGSARVADRSQRERNLGRRARWRTAWKKECRSTRCSGRSRCTRFTPIFARARAKRLADGKAAATGAPAGGYALNSARTSRLSSLPISL